jgi:hypothetical protein
MFVLGLGLLGILLAVGVLLVRSRLNVGAVAENRDQPRLAEEELVQRFIIRNSPDPKRVKFYRWGPHLLANEIRELSRDGVPIDFGGVLIRVVYEGRDSAAIWPEEVDPLVLDLAPGRDRFGREVMVPSKPHVVVKEGRHDRLFMVSGKMVFPYSDNSEGDEWKRKGLKSLGKAFPGINSEQR